MQWIKRCLTWSTIAVVAAVSLASCSTPDNEKATVTFADCLRRNGVEAESVEVTMGSDGQVEGISLVIINEGNVAYEPTLRLACTEEVELNQ